MRAAPMNDHAGFPPCLKCGTGVLLPLSGAGPDGTSLRYRAWVCSKPDCGFNVRIDEGEISFGLPVSRSYR